MDLRDKEENCLKVLGYQICGMIGEGATGCVYWIKERMTGRDYACKISDFTQRLEAEAKLLQTLRHPLFPLYRDYYEADGRSYLIMEYIGGISLQKHLNRRGRFSQRETIRIVTELADGLGYLHERTPAVIYRDIKPANIILQPDGRARLLDLGAAAASSRWRVGTVGYAAPEQLGDEGKKEGCYLSAGSLLPACDVYGLGKLMHHMLTGYDPLKHHDMVMPVRAYCREINRGIEEIVQRCIAGRPEERIPGMRELVRELSAYYNKTPLQRLAGDVICLIGLHRTRTIYIKNIWLSRYKTGF